MSYALAAVLLAASAASAQVRLVPPRLAAPQLAVRILGVPGPGITPAHLEAVSAMALAAQTPIVIHGSRQTGFSHHTGLPFKPDTDLDLGVIGKAEDILKIEQDMWDGRVPHATHMPMLAVPTIEDAVGKGHLVVAPPRARSVGDLGILEKHANPWRTDEQLTKLAASPRSASESFTFAVIGDAEPGRFWISRKMFNSPGVFWKLLRRAERSKPDFILQLGDMVSRGTISNFWTFIKGLILSRTETPYLTVIGNHDRHKPHGVTNDRVYRAVFGSTDYSFTRGGYKFVIVDSSAGRITAPQLEWLRRELSPSVPTVVFTHIPPAPLSEWTDWGRLKGAGGFWEGSTAFMDLMSANKVARVYMGHIHGLGTLERGGVKYVLTGGGGSPLFPGPVKRRLHHWLSVEAGPAGLVETVQAADGSSFLLR